MPDRPLKILYLSALDDPKDGAGAERTLNLLMKSVRNLGHDVAIAATSAEGGLHRHERDGLRIWRAGLKNIYFPSRTKEAAPWPLRRTWHLLDSYNVFMKAQLRKIIAAEQPDLISAHQLSGWSVSALDAAREAGIPVVQVLHDYYNACPNSMLFKDGHDCVRQCAPCRVLRGPAKAVSGRVSAVVGVSRYVLNRHLELGFYEGCAERHVIHNARLRAGLRLDEAAALRGAYLRAKKAGDLTLGFIGTLAPHKGLEVLLDVVRELADERVRVVVAGSGRADYVQALRDKYASAAVRFLGHVEPYEYFARVDVNVVPSLWQEPLGGIVLEGFAFGVPVIVSQRGGSPEMVTDGKNGILFEPNRPDELREAIGVFLESSGAAERFAEQARMAGRDYLDTDGWAGKYVAMYSRLAAGAR
jgi:glycosyltransferase involved in cell wall biosynthesis